MDHKHFAVALRTYPQRIPIGKYITRKAITNIAPLRTSKYIKQSKQLMRSRGMCVCVLIHLFIYIYLAPTDGGSSFESFYTLRVAPYIYYAQARCRHTTLNILSIIFMALRKKQSVFEITPRDRSLGLRG